MGEHKFTYVHFQTSQQLEASVTLHVPTALSPGQAPTVSIDWMAGWTPPRPVVFRQTKKISPMPWIQPRFLGRHCAVYVPCSSCYV